jgi:hypothetical protein
MPEYECPACEDVVAIIRKLAPGESKTCPACKNGTITSAHLFVPSSKYEPKKKKRQSSGVQGRPDSAPPRTTWPGTNLNSAVTHVPLLSAAAWKQAKPQRICLAYNLLDISRPGIEGLLIKCPKAKSMPNVQAHFGAIKHIVANPPNDKTVTEMTGEAAAALCVLTRHSFAGGGISLTLAGFQLEWGRHTHAGAGIDQIWKRATNVNQYLIVEAKGPNARLKVSAISVPPDFDQMSIRWVMHNLEKMSKNHNQVATDIINDLRLTMHTRWPNFGGSSTNYYGVQSVGNGGVGELYRVVVEAVWQPDGMLSFSASKFKQYTQFAY